MPQIDIDLPLLRRIVASLDALLHELSLAATASDDPDGMGLLDQIESVVGLGFVACQNYMTTRVERRPKAAALGCGPMHGPLHLATIVNAGANYWKHHPEWPYDENELTGQPKATADTLRAAGVWQHDYKLTCLLHELVAPAPLSFEALLPHLRAWRDALDPGGFLPR